MQFHPFELERFLSEYEQTVEYNFTESGVHPVTLGELLAMAGDDAGALLETPLNYPHVNGTPLLRQQIAARYPGADEENVLVTVGASEANLLAATTLLQPGDEIVTTRPTYLQFGGIARNMGVTVRTVDLLEEEGWALDLEGLERLVTERTKVLAVVNPNNPTGHIFTPAEMDAVVDAARRADAWLLADEVYAGAERAQTEETPTFYGRYDKLIALNSLSKAYGLPGLRIGWMVGPAETIQALWRRHEYAAVSASMLGNRLAEIALSPAVRPQLIARTRGLIRDGYDVLTERLAEHPDVFSVVAPQASALSFVRDALPMGSTELAARLRQSKGVLVVPGDAFGLDKHLRIQSALPVDYLQRGFRLLSQFVGELR
jgi:aspartate/methionine/tyrosine aminotransferase